MVASLTSMTGRRWVHQTITTAPVHAMIPAVSERATLPLKPISGN